MLTWVGAAWLACFAFFLELVGKATRPPDD
jgi:hypothetical protein